MLTPPFHSIRRAGFATLLATVLLTALCGSGVVAAARAAPATMAFATSVAASAFAVMLTSIIVHRWGMAVAWIARSSRGVQRCFGAMIALLSISCSFALMLLLRGLTGYPWLIFSLLFGALAVFVAQAILLLLGRGSVFKLIRRLHRFVPRTQRRELPADKSALTLRHLTPAGRWVLLLTLLATFGAGVPLAFWMYGGVRPAGWSNKVLALPIIGVGLAVAGLGILLCRVLGVRLLRRF